MSGVGKRFQPAFSSIGFRLPTTAFLLISLTLATFVGCGGGAPALTPQATITVSPATLSFSGTAGGANPAIQAVTLSNAGTATLSFTATAASTPSGWLAVSPTSGTVAAGGSTSLTVSANIATLTAGSFTGTISVSDPAASNSPQSVSVNLTASGPTPSSRHRFRRQTSPRRAPPTRGQVGAPVIITTSLPDGTLGTAYSATLKAPGGVPPFTWNIDEGGAALPPGVTLDPSSGVLSGVPMRAGTFNFTARVTDSASPPQSDTQPLILTVR